MGNWDELKSSKKDHIEGRSGYYCWFYIGKSDKNYEEQQNPQEKHTQGKGNSMLKGKVCL